MEKSDAFSTEGTTMELAVKAGQALMQSPLQALCPTESLLRRKPELNSRETARSFVFSGPGAVGIRRNALRGRAADASRFVYQQVSANIPWYFYACPRHLQRPFSLARTSHMPSGAQILFS